MKLLAIIEEAAKITKKKKNDKQTTKGKAKGVNSSK